MADAAPNPSPTGCVILITHCLGLLLPFSSTLEAIKRFLVRKKTIIELFDEFFQPTMHITKFFGVYIHSRKSDGFKASGFKVFGKVFIEKGCANQTVACAGLRSERCL